VGRYRLVYQTKPYYEAKNFSSVLYSITEVNFEKVVGDVTITIIVTAGPYSFSAYKGSSSK
jgi:5-hydroxyisourate hydrolase-like protein (transthyretin family)